MICMKKIFLILISFIMMQHSNAQAVSQYEKIQDTANNETIYKGSCTFQDIMALPQFDSVNTDEMVVDAKDINYLQQHLKDYTLIAFLGTWCEDSQHHIPELYEVLQASAYPVNNVQLYALDHDKKGTNEVEKKYSIEWVPTIIVFKEGKEAGRITEHPKKSIAEDLVTIIKKH